ncbi:MAG: cell wall-binding repeat-containing protein, partial [Acidimicrobiales bacterium]
TLKVKNVVILGGTSAVSSDVATALANTASTSSAGGNLSVTRVFGNNRYETMQAIDTAFGASAVGSIGGKKTAIVASGANFPDSLAAGGASYKAHLPIVLTTPDRLSDEAAHTLTALGVQQVLIMGGTAAVQSAVNAAIQGMGIAIAKQFSGVDRTDTAAQFAGYAVANLGFSNHEVVVTRGDGFADALAGAQYVGDPKVLILLETSSVVGLYDAQYLADHQAEIAAITGLGGVQGLTVAAFDSAIAAASGLIVTSVTPSSMAIDGQDHQLTIHGQGFSGVVGSAIGPSASNTNPATGQCGDADGLIQTNSETVVSDTEIHATYRIPSGCPFGPYSVLVARTGPDVLFDCEACLTVTNVLFVGSIAPSTVASGSTTQVAILGGGFTPNSTASVSASAANTNPQGPGCGGAGVASAGVGGLTFVSSTQLNGTLTIPPGCPTGVWDVVVDNSSTGGGFAVCQQCLTVTGSGPTGTTTTTSPTATTTTTLPPAPTVQMKVVTTESCLDNTSADPLPRATVVFGVVGSGGVAVTTGGDGTNSGNFANVPSGMQNIHGNGTIISFQVTPDFGANSGVGTHLVGNDQSFNFYPNPNSGNNGGAPDWVVAARFQKSVGC